MRIKTVAIAAALILSTFGHPVSAEIVDVSFSGTLDDSYTTAAYRGTSFSGSFSYDSAQAPYETNSYGGGTIYRYAPFLVTPLTVTGLFGSAAASGRGSATLFSNTFGSGSLQVSANPDSRPFAFRFYTSDASYGIGGLPTTFTAPNLSSNFYADLGGGTIVYGRINTVSPMAVAAIPEPASWAMMIVGVGAIGGGLRQRRRATVAFA